MVIIMRIKKMFDEPELNRAYRKALKSGAFDALKKASKKLKYD